MATDFSDAIRQIQEDKGISEDLVLKTVEEFLLAAYKRKYGTSENASVTFNDDYTGVTIHARKTIVDDDDFYDPVTEIILSEALKLNDECEPGDELDIEIDPQEFDRVAVQSAKQKAKQNLREIQKDTLYSEFRDKVGEMVIGYYQREKNGNLFVDLGRTEGILPKRYQSPREEYHAGDRIKALIYEVAKSPSGLQIVLSRTHTDFVRCLFELEVPEIYDNTITIEKLVREPGYRTKIAVLSNRDEVDPVGACVGLKGVRIQAVVREMEGEKIDILRYDPDPIAFIKNALSPAQVQDVVILDGSKRQALAIVPQDQLSLAIGKQGLNVRLANRLVDWNIDVKTEAQFQEMDIAQEISREASDLFQDIDEETEEISRVNELPGLSQRLVSLLQENGIEYIESLITMDQDDLAGFQGVTEEDVVAIKSVIDDCVQIIEEDAYDEEEDDEDVSDDEDEEIDTDDSEEIEEDGEEEGIDEEDTFECPECGSAITTDMSSCPNCGVGLSFEYEEDESDE